MAPAVLALWVLAPAQTLYAEGLRIDLDAGLVRDGLRAPAPLAEAPVLRGPLRAARDETVAFQVVVPGPSRTASVAVTGLPSGVHATIYEERAVHIRAPSESPAVYSLGAGAYPDILIPTTTVAAPAVVWIDLYVARDAPPGEAVLKVEIDDAPPVELELEILELTLPEDDVAKLGAVNFGSLLVREKVAPALLLRWMQLAHAHHLNVELMRPVPAIAADGTIDWAGWGERFAPYLDGSAFTAAAGYVGPRAGRPVTRFVAPLAEHWPVPADGHLPSDGARWSRVLRELEDVAATRRWFDGVEWILFLNSLDEPKKPEELEAMAKYGPLIAAAELQDRRRFHFRTDGTLGIDIDAWPDERKLAELGEVVDLWNLHGAVDTAPIALLAQRLRAHPEERAIFYASNSGGEPAIPPLVADSAIAGARAWAWIVERYGLAGALNWELDYAEGCVEEPRCSEGGTLNLDALLVYRGHEVGRAAHEPIPSMRLKALRRGADDARLLALLRAKDPAAADRIVRRVVPRALGDGLPLRGRGTWPRHARAYEQARGDILAALGAAPARSHGPPIGLVAIVLAVLAALATGIFTARSRRR